ncbi:MAG: hypothetical protein RMK18_04600 [Armatimonadota bacterium]|nr:hypothetical protein [Armatimonadota bacterium]MCX7777083.1 hypothetical protein [Armatimonadota bacterium]MDW8025130.1 hypothetical protein [Armatimonadota bacterium]
MVMYLSKCGRLIVLTLWLFTMLATAHPAYSGDGQDIDRVQSISVGSDSQAVGEPNTFKGAAHKAMLRAWRIHWEPMGSTISAIGDVELNYGELSLRASQLQYDTKGNRVMAPSGATVMIRDKLVLKGESALYNLDERRGVVTSVKASYGMLSFAARRASIVDDDAVFEDGKLTTCNKAHPHYELAAKRIQIARGEQVIIDGLSGRLYGFRLPKLPKQRFRFGGGGGDSLPFMLYINSADGVYAGFNYSRQLGGSISRQPTMLSCSMGLSAKEDWRGRLVLMKPWRYGEVRLGIAHKDVISDELTRGLFLNILPEVGVSGTQEVKPLRLSIYGDISYGRYTERYVNRVSSRRLNIQLGLRDAARLNEHWRWNFDMLLRYSHYKGDEFKLARLMMGMNGRIGNRVNGSIAFVHHIQSGRTPFEFDDIDIRTECRVGGYAWLVYNRWKLIYDLRYDASQRKMRNWGVGLVYRAHCIEWGIAYDLSRREFRVIVDLVGVTTPK